MSEKKKGSSPSISKEQIAGYIRSYVETYGQTHRIATAWGTPLVGFADAGSLYLQQLPRLISPEHSLPQDVLPGATIVIAYYVPFTSDLAATNARPDDLASPDWARAYEETNAMFQELNAHLIHVLAQAGYQGLVAPAAAGFDHEKLISSWSHRHMAYAAGLGTFGLNNMLITRSGCCGRYHSLVTDLDVEPDHILDEEYCLYKKNGSCGVCLRHCPVQALSTHGYDRHRCYGLLQKNAEIYTDFGSSYGSAEAGQAGGSEVCGKCVTQSPCAFWTLRG